MKSKYTLAYNTIDKDDYKVMIDFLKKEESLLNLE